jgi:hypothetical protein
MRERAMPKKTIMPIAVPVLVFAVYFILGLFIYRDYGSFWDEGIERFSGIVSAKAMLQTLDKNLPQRVFGERINGNIPQVSAYGNKYYGVILQFPQLAIDHLLHDKRDIWQSRHLYMFILFFISVIAFFFLLRRIFDDWILGLIGSLVLILTPRFFAESFYNIKDIGFFSTLTVGFYFLVVFVDKPKIVSALLLGIFIAFSSAVRIIGLVLLPFGLAYIALSAIKKELKWRDFFRLGLTLTASTIVFLIAFYPASWSNPFVFFHDAIYQMSHYPWSGDILFMGRIYHSQDLPWYYLLVWMGVTIPIPVLILALCGLISPLLTPAGFRSKAGRSLPLMSWLFAVIVFFGMMFYVIVKAPTVYDSWRQFYFLYLPVLLLSVLGVRTLHMLVVALLPGKERQTGAIGGGILAVLFIPSLFFIIASHPYQNVYFNALAGKNAFSLFEKDYWCLSYTRALNMLAQIDKSDRVAVWNNGPVEPASEMMKPQDRARFVFVSDKKDAEYYLNNFRAVIYNPEVPNELFNISVLGRKILSVQKLR